MNKLISMMIVFVMSFMSISAFAAYEAPVRFAQIYNYGEKVYVRNRYGTNGGITFKRGNVNIHNLPDSIYKVDTLWKFCFYNNKIYFLAGEDGSVDIPASIYSCDIDGSNIRLLANNAWNYSDVYIVDNVLYYDAYSSQNAIDDIYYQGYYGGIYSINLEDLSWKKIVNRDNISLSYCDGEYAYYYVPRIDKCYATSVDGMRTVMVSDYCDEVYWGSALKGSQTYYMYDRDVYVRNKNGNNDIWITCIPRDDSHIEVVTDDNIYVVALGSGSDYASAYVYEINR